MNLGERIYTLRSEKEMSQGDLAEALDVSRQSISKWETNGSVPELDKLVKLSEVFGVSLYALITVKEEKQSVEQETERQVVYIEKSVKQKHTAVQKWSIVLCSLVCFLLLVNLFILFGKQQGSASHQQVTIDHEFMASDVNCMEIEWNTGSVRIIAAETDMISISGAISENDMFIAVQDGVLKMLPRSGSVLSGKELLICVPKDWICQELKLKGTSATMDLVGISVGTLDLSGSSCTLTYYGGLEEASINGTSVTATLSCTTPVSGVRVNGNRSSLMLTLPKGCGFLVNMQIPNCQLHSDLTGVRYENHKYYFGDQYCKMVASGSACDMYISQSN